jgi:hypothetical protein
MKPIKKKSNQAVENFYPAQCTAYNASLLEKNEASTTLLAHEYFLYRMYEKRDMRVITDAVKVRDMATALHRYSTGASALTPLELAMHDTTPTTALSPLGIALQRYPE